MADANTHHLCDESHTSLTQSVGSDRGNAGGSGLFVASALTSQATQSRHATTPLHRNDARQLRAPAGCAGGTKQRMRSACVC
jgi:hypothetical protein